MDGPEDVVLRDVSKRKDTSREVPLLQGPQRSHFCTDRKLVDKLMVPK